MADGFKRSEVEDRLAIQKEMTSLGVQAMGAYGEYKKREAATAAAQRLTQEGVPASEMESRIKNSEEVRKAGESYAPGSAYWAAGTALTAALSGGLGGNLGGAVSGAAAPYLAKLVKDVSDGNEPVRVALHTVLGAFLARTQGGSATGGALGGFTAAAASGLIAQALYPKEKMLSAEQKQLVANLVMIAGAGVGGIAGGNLIDAGSAANTARNEVENNFLSAKEAEKKTALERKEKDGTLTADEAKELADTRQLDKDRDQAIRDICTQGNKSGGACSALVAQAQQALNSYGESAASYRLIFKDLYPQDAANASAILKGLDEGSITRDAAITAIAKATGKGWDEVASQYDSVMQLHGMVSTLAGFYGVNSVSQSAEATNTTMSMADRIKANIAESQQARESSNFGIHIAKSDQIQWGYAADEWGTVTLPSDSKVYGGIPGQSSYYTSWDTLLDAGFSRESIFKSLQVLPHPEFGYRPQMGVYEVVNDITIPSGQVMANPLLGPGGGTQYFIKDYGNQLKLIDKIDLGK
ncbi:VENN motif pre-toxin domain-containing protein [Dickeya fangzhongdai]|uniref:VENN motif pre-toxin domain-containing protein n=1 Tax=Dickeya fangzhongdai TaxID=1778540 RepID=UPI002B29A70E|nr:VENN motif pre-toxin domain-containing protein [Dickeya fangzhongdai]